VTPPCGAASIATGGNVGGLLLPACTIPASINLVAMSSSRINS